MSEGFDVMIVGAGAAGLAAARDLSVAGHKVVVLEARDRIGGRIFTLNDPTAPVPIELGAEFVHGKPPEVCDIAQRRNLKLSEVSGRHWYFENGKLRKSDQFWARIEKLNEQMESVAADQSLKDFLSTLPDDEETQRVRDIATLYVEGFHAASSDRIGIRGLIKANEAAESIEGYKSFRFLDGYNSLVEVLRAEAGASGAAIHLNTVVKEIRRSAEGVEAVCDEGRSFAASQAVITLPLGVLQTRAVRFSPELPPEKQAAINNLTMGHVLRIVLHFRARFWETLTIEDEDGNPVKFADAAFIHSDGLAFPTWWSQLPVRAPVLVGWVGGPEADRITAASHELSTGMKRPGITLADDSGTPLGSFVTDQAIASLAQIFDLSTDYILEQLATVYFHDWQHDQFSRGAYGYVPVEGLDDQRVLAQPVDGTLFFAGEATTVGHIGTVHGAIMSGQRAAREILATRQDGTFRR